MKKLNLVQMKKVNGGDCDGIKRRFARSHARGRERNTERLYKRLTTECR